MPFHILQSKDRLDLAFEEYHGLVQIILDPAKAFGVACAYMAARSDTGMEIRWSWRRPASRTGSGSMSMVRAGVQECQAYDAYAQGKDRSPVPGVEFTLDDPTYYTRPWSWMRDYSWRPDMILFHEYNCELQTGAKDGVDPSLVPSRRTDEPAVPVHCRNGRACPHGCSDQYGASATTRHTY